MGTYFNPVTKLEQEGRRIQGREYSALRMQLRTGERLYGVFNRGIFKCAPLLDTEGEFKEFMAQYRAGNFLSADFYAIPAALADEFSG